MEPDEDYENPIGEYPPLEDDFFQEMIAEWIANALLRVLDMALLEGSL